MSSLIMLRWYPLMPINGFDPPCCNKGGDSSEFKEEKGKKKIKTKQKDKK